MFDCYELCFYRLTRGVFSLSDKLLNSIPNTFNVRLQSQVEIFLQLCLSAGEE